jgi:DNA replication and repair protein RecF
VFLPDRLELVKGAPTLRRAHLDQLVCAIWPARTVSRRAYAQALAQRNALIARIRSGRVSADSLRTWDAQLAVHGVALMSDRARAVATIDDAFARIAESLGLDQSPTVAYRPRSKATDAAGLAAELAERRDSDVERGFTGHGPHRDDLVAERDGREIRAYGSQGQQRLAVLALLLAERDAIAATRFAAPLMLLDDVMSELDFSRRAALVALLRRTGGQSVITTTDVEHVPGADEPGVMRLAVDAGVVEAEVLAA